MSEKCLSLKLLNSKASKVSTHFYTKFGIKIKNLVLCWCSVILSRMLERAHRAVHSPGNRNVLQVYLVIYNEYSVSENNIKLSFSFVFFF